jgi:hypothetical protein
MFHATPSRLRAASSTVSVSCGHPSSVSSSRVNGSQAMGRLGPALPALLTSTSSRPWRATSCSTAARACPASPASKAATATRAGAARVSRRSTSRAAARRSASRPTITTVAPSFRYRRVITWPMLPAAPVITATRPASRPRGARRRS